MSDTFSPDDVKFMQLALELAAKGQYTTTPNPSVGCVLVKNGEIVGKGFHFKVWHWQMPVRKRKAQPLM